MDLSTGCSYRSFPAATRIGSNATGTRYLNISVAIFHASGERPAVLNLREDIEMSMRRNLSPLVREDLRLRFKRRIAFLSLVGAVLFATVSQAGCQRIESRKEAGSEAADTNAKIQAINSIISKYAKSIDDADTTAAAQIWEADSPEVSFIHPLGHEHGFEQIKHNLYEKLMGETFAERKLSVHDVSVHVSKDSAWAEFYWDFAAKFRKDGSSLTTKGRETQVYRKGANGWRLVHVHYSGMPVTGGRQGF